MLSSIRRVSRTAARSLKKRFISNSSPEDYAYVTDLVKSSSWDNYMVSFMMPESLKIPFVVFQGYNINIAHSLEQARGNQLSARVRLQWWRDKVDDMVNERFMLENPVLKCLCDVYNTFLFNPIYLDHIIEAREMDMNESQPNTLQELFEYGENVYGSIFHISLFESTAAVVALILMYMLAQCYELTEDENLTQKINHVSHTMSLATFLRALPFHFAQHRTYLPKDICDSYNMTESDCYDGNNEKAIKVIRDLNTIAIDEYKKSKAIKCEKDGKAILRMGSPSILYAKSLKKHNYNVYDQCYFGQKMRNHVQFRLLYDKMFNSY